jgi:hypothetical protein
MGALNVRHTEKIDPKNWRATANVFCRDNQKTIGKEIVGFGTTMKIADDDAIRQGRSFASAKGQPADWNASVRTGHIAQSSNLL